MIKIATGRIKTIIYVHNRISGLLCITILGIFLSISFPYPRYIIEFRCINLSKTYQNTGPFHTLHGNSTQQIKYQTL